MVDTSPAGTARRRNRTVISAVAAALAAALVAGTGYWWYERSLPSQASAADCRLAQRIATEARQIASGPAADAETWARKIATERRSKMKDGYLGLRVSQYEAWALLTAQKSPDAPSAQDVGKYQDKAREHCAQSGVTVSMQPLGS
ncbi:hypothetical protein ACFVZC_29785 [Streptomyces marokkonensis]|uniref:Uncharacterized protein n=1 Tax=Streptomyces marokkonensis TaxID=324855 RepID=A0ABW6QE94_9ACTN